MDNMNNRNVLMAAILLFVRNGFRHSIGFGRRRCEHGKCITTYFTQRNQLLNTYPFKGVNCRGLIEEYRYVHLIKKKKLNPIIFTSFG